MVPARRSWAPTLTNTPRDVAISLGLAALMNQRKEQACSVKRYVGRRAVPGTRCCTACFPAHSTACCAQTTPYCLQDLPCPLWSFSCTRNPGSLGTCPLPSPTSSVYQLLFPGDSTSYLRPSGEALPVTPSPPHVPRERSVRPRRSETQTPLLPHPHGRGYSLPPALSPVGGSDR